MSTEATSDPRSPCVTHSNVPDPAHATRRTKTWARCPSPPPRPIPSPCRPWPASEQRRRPRPFPRNGPGFGYQPGRWPERVRVPPHAMKLGGEVGPDWTSHWFAMSPSTATGACGANGGPMRTPPAMQTSPDHQPQPAPIPGRLAPDHPPPRRHRPGRPTGNTGFRLGPPSTTRIQPYAIKQLAAAHPRWSSAWTPCPASATRGRPPPVSPQSDRPIGATWDPAATHAGGQVTVQNAPAGDPAGTGTSRRCQEPSRGTTGGGRFYDTWAEENRPCSARAWGRRNIKGMQAPSGPARQRLNVSATSVKQLRGYSQSFNRA